MTARQRDRNRVLSYYHLASSNVKLNSPNNLKNKFNIFA